MENIKVESPLGFRVKMRNLMVIEDSIKRGGKTTKLIRILGYFQL
jgi:hypothetical protein